MLNIEEIYSEKLGTFLDLHRRVGVIVWEVFPSADQAELEDLTDLRKLVEKIEEAASIADGFYRFCLLRATRDKRPNLPESSARSQDRGSWPMPR